MNTTILHNGIDVHKNNISVHLTTIPIKCLLIMKLLAFYILVLCACSFGRVNAQKVSLDVKNAAFQDVALSIQKQTGYSFAINKRYLEKAKPVTIQINQVDLTRALDQLFRDQPFTYTMDGKVITLIDKKTSTSRNYPDDHAQQETIRGRVTDSIGNPLPNVTVTVIGSSIKGMTDDNGYYELSEAIAGNTLRFTAVGYRTREMQAVPGLNTVQLTRQVHGITVIDLQLPHTGYQSLPKERATGSFAQIDNALLNRTVSTGVMDRIADVVPGLIFNKGVGGAQGLVIRGQTSINQETSLPLIVVDNFPYEGDINNINPNDVENITILKDAAASSIWGARAGNGVIVITTKQGKFNQKPQLTFNMNYTGGERPDLFYQPRVSTSDFIDNEIRLFNLDVYKPAENNQSLLHYPLTPVVELLIKKRNNPALAAEIDATIDSWRGYDVRNDIEKYYYRPLDRQQYAIQLQGGNDQNRYLLSVGYDKNRDSEVGNGLGRLTLNANNTYSFIKDKLELQTNLYYTGSKVDNNFEFPVYYTHNYGAQASFMYPYARFADDSGNALATGSNYRQYFIEDMEAQGFLDWQYRPLDEIKNADKSINSKEYRFNSALSYTIVPGLNAQVRYQYSSTNGLDRDYYSEETYFTRNLINYYSTINTGSGAINRGIPVGGILDTDRSTVISHHFRTHMNYDKVFNGLHELNALAGYEISDQKTERQWSRLYGYDDKYATSQVVNYALPYSISIYPSASYQFRVPSVDRVQELTNRFVSWFGNFGYRYDKRYLLSGSIRFDQSNIFGVRTNQRGVPLYSIGGAWQVNEEDFFRSDWINEIKLRTTWGASGNVNRSLSAMTTINYSTGVDPLTGFQYADVGRAPNPNLRWEKIKSLNIGLDFDVLGRRINGSIDWYKKWGYDIFSRVPYAPQSGFNQFTGNYSDTEAKGIDLILQIRNLIGAFQWTTDIQLSYVSDKVVKSKLLSTQSGFTLLTGSHGINIVPYEGKPLYAVYGYRWAGLDPDNGDPMGYLDGEVSKNWSGIANDIRANPDHLAFYGTARPKYFGAIRNTFQFRRISLSANISYRFDYYFRRNSVDFTALNLGTTWEHADAAKAWKVPGDEARTAIPSIPGITTTSSRSGFYSLNESLIEKGDHIRLNDVTVSYTLAKSQFQNLPFRQLRIYGLANNLGILWKATKFTEDPDYYSAMFTPVRTYSVGISANF